MHIVEDGRAPNPRRVRIFLAEKDIAIEYRQLDMMVGEHKKPEHTARNPFGRIPYLVLDDDTVIAETVAICRYFDAIKPEPALFGETPVEQGIVEMWNRRLELNFFFPIAQSFRHCHPRMAELEVPQIKEWGEANVPRVHEVMALMNDHLADNEFFAGDFYSIADITGLAAIDFMKFARIDMNEDHTHLARWRRQVSERPSAKA